MRFTDSPLVLAHPPLPHRPMGPRGEVIRPRGEAAPGPTDQLARQAWQASVALGTGAFAVNRDGQDYQIGVGRLLTDDQCRLIYQRTPDVRASVDAVVRQVAQHPWWVQPTVDPADPAYDDLLVESELARRRFAVPNQDREVWGELLSKLVTDWLIYDRGVMELVSSRPGGAISELTALRGADVWSVRDGRGRLLRYRQGVRPTPSVPTPAPGPTDLRSDQVLMLSLFANTEGPDGFPILESLIWEVIALLRGAEGFARQVDYNEVPEGLLFVVGYADDAVERLRTRFADRARERGDLQILGSPVPGMMDAKWLTMRPNAVDADESYRMDAVRRTIWRLYGVMPVEMGATEGMPRATAQVQLDASGSHLIRPLLHLLQAKLNEFVLPRLVAPEAAGLVAFGFDLEQRLSASDQEAVGRTHVAYVDAGILTRNEVRDELGHQPLEGGDDATVTGQVVRLEAAVAEPDGTDAEAEPEGGDGVDSEEVDGAAEDEADAEGGERTIGRRARRSRAQVRAARLVAQRRAWAESPLVARVQRSADLVGDMPSSWRRPSAFAGTRTVDLEGLWAEVARYARDVGDAWDGTAALALADVETALSADDDMSTVRAFQAVQTRLADLASVWAEVTSDRYRQTALLAHRTVSSWTGLARSEREVVEDAAAFGRAAMAYLVDDGPLLAVIDRAGKALTAAREQRSGPSVRSMSDADREAMRAVEAAFVAERYRIGNFAGRLVELAHEEADRSLAAGAASGRADGVADAEGPEAGPVEWWAQWSAVGDAGTCATCSRMASLGFQPVSTFPTVPGAATECGARCRCVLVYWTREEVASGRASRV